MGTVAGRFSPHRTVAIMCLALLGLTACAETKFAVTSAKKIGVLNRPSAPGDPSAPDLGVYKIGKPYQIKGQWHYPAVDYQYRETGIASWYGPNFHGKPTANGGIFDMNKVSAAHRTLPMPSMVRVTNLENGRALNLLVNDRGPFARGRIIDLSRRAAELLGMKTQGTARVSVEILAEQSRNLALRSSQTTPSRAEQAAVKAAPRRSVGSTSLPGTSGAVKIAAPAATVTRPANSATNSVYQEPKVELKLVRPSQLFIQFGAFSNPQNATHMLNAIQSYGPSRIDQVRINGRDIYRVRLGPLQSTEEVDILLDQVVRAGHSTARVISD